MKKINSDRLMMKKINSEKNQWKKIKKIIEE